MNIHVLMLHRKFELIPIKLDFLEIFKVTSNLAYYSFFTVSKVTSLQVT